MNQVTELPHVPVVTTSDRRTVLVELSPDDAQALAHVLAHYDAIVTWRGPEGQRVPVADAYVADVWHHTLIRLIAEAEKARLEIPPAAAVLVPFRRPEVPTQRSPR